MHCPNCGKMLELKEGDFCTGCGADIDGVVESSRNKWNKPQSKAGMLPYGTRYISSNVAMNAMAKGLVLGAVIGFIIMMYFGSYIFAFSFAGSISFAMLGVLPFALLGALVCAKLPENAQATLASAFSFIRTEGTLYHIIDFLCLHLPFMAPDSKKNNTGKKKPRK